jgi:hypothetical protein
MGYTDGKWEQGTPQSDLQIFIGASDFVDTSAHATLASAGAGLFSLNVAASLAATLFVNLKSMLRTGVYATPALTQEQFGTAAAQPGPSSVSGTSGPLALLAGYPPLTTAQLATLGHQLTGPLPRGIQIDSIDVIYAVGTNALTTATIGLTKTVFVNAVAPAVTNIIALGANGLPTAAAAQPYVTNVANAAPVMITDSDAELICNVNLTTPAGGTAVFYGIVVKAHYNLN